MTPWSCQCISLELLEELLRDVGRLLALASRDQLILRADETQGSFSPKQGAANLKPWRRGTGIVLVCFCCRVESYDKLGGYLVKEQSAWDVDWSSPRQSVADVPCRDSVKAPWSAVPWRNLRDE